MLSDHGSSLPDDRPCEAALSPIRGEPAASDRPVPLDRSRRHLVAAFVPGVGFACMAPWLNPTHSVARHLARFDYGFVTVDVDALSGTEANARRIREFLLGLPEESGPARVVLVGYSKGAPDILEAIARYPEMRARIAAVVSLAGAVRGSPLADDAGQWQADLFRHWPGADCDAGDGGAVASLRPAIRDQWLSENPLPDGLSFYSVVTLPTPDRVSRLLEVTHRKLGRIDWRNDGQVLHADQIVPGSTLLGFLNADHWAAAVPIGRTHPAVADAFVDRNDYPREALLEAVLRFVEEDLDQRR